MAATKTAKQLEVIDQYDVAADSKRRVSLRGTKWKHFRVKALSNGAFLLEPRVLAPPDEISARTLRMLEKAAANFKNGRASAPIDLTQFQEK